MEKVRPERRRWLAVAPAVAVATLLGRTARPLAAVPALAAPAGPVLLSISGVLGRPNDGAGASFDLALLRTLPQTSFSTTTPWYSTPRKFTGVLFSDLLAAVDSQATQVSAIALNDYRIDMPVADLTKDGAMVAWMLDERPMAVRELGPLVIIFPFSERAELRTAVNYSRAVWQLRRLELR